MARTIQSPGVEINEVDLTLRSEPTVGTSIFVAGFSNQGPIDEVLQPTSISEFEEIYGTPTNSAERYFYHTVKNVLNTSKCNVLVSRLPYGDNRGDGFSNWRYSALAYPVKSVDTTLDDLSSFQVNDILLALSGYGYDVTPNINVIGDGIGTVVIPNMGDDGLGTNTYGISSLTIVSLGENYLTEPTIEVDKSYVITSIFVSQSGSGYSTPPNISIGGVYSDQALAVANMANDGLGTGTFGVSSITLTYTGRGYKTTPTILISGQNNTPATAVVVYTEGSSVIAVNGDQSVSKAYNTLETPLSSASTYFVGKPTHVELSASQYQMIQEGGIKWSGNPEFHSEGFVFDTLKDAALIVLNKSQTTVNNKFEGYYVGMADNNNFNPATDFNSVVSVKSVNRVSDSIVDYLTIPNTRLNFVLSASKLGDTSSISEVMEGLTQYNLSERSFDDTVSFGLFKIRQSVFSPDSLSLDYVLSESYTGSLDYHRQIGDSNGGNPLNFHIGKVAENSSNINILVNPHLSNKNRNSWLNSSGIPTKKVRFLTTQLETPLNGGGFKDTIDTYVTRVGATSASIIEYSATMGKADSLFSLGVYSDTISDKKTIGGLPLKIERAFELVDNSDVYPIDIALEAGLGTIFVNAIEQNNITNASDVGFAGPYDESVSLAALSSFYSTSFDNLDTNLTRIRGNYTAVANVFINNAEKQRKDFLVVLDPLRNIFVQGDNEKVINMKKIFSPNAGLDIDPTAAGYVTTNFSQHIYWPLRHQFATIDCSYAATYGNWAQVYDDYSGNQVWVPFSGIAGGLMANTDDLFEPWYAPAGFTRGIVTGANDLALYPKQKQRDQLYKISINPVAFFPNEGFVVFGQKTLLKKPSAFDRINVRRLFLALEKLTKNTAKFFVFEPNTLFTRTQVINILSPIFERAKNTEGLYDYRIVCSELNNTPDVIDNNELKIDIYIQPVRTAEFILVNFYATRTGTNFDELIGG
jgi:hypothetical protein